MHSQGQKSIFVNENEIINLSKNLSFTSYCYTINVELEIKEFEQLAVDRLNGKHCEIFSITIVFFFF